MVIVMAYYLVQKKPSLELFFRFVPQEAKIAPPLQRLNSASCVLDRYGQRVTSLSKPQRTNRGESLFFEDSGKKRN